MYFQIAIVLTLFISGQVIGACLPGQSSVDINSVPIAEFDKLISSEQISLVFQSPLTLKTQAYAASVSNSVEFKSTNGFGIKTHITFKNIPDSKSVDYLRPIRLKAGYTIQIKFVNDRGTIFTKNDEHIEELSFDMKEFMSGWKNKTGLSYESSTLLYLLQDSNNLFGNVQVCKEELIPEIKKNVCNQLNIDPITTLIQSVFRYINDQIKKNVMKDTCKDEDAMIENKLSDNVDKPIILSGGRQEIIGSIKK